MLYFSARERVAPPTEIRHITLHGKLPNYIISYFFYRSKALKVMFPNTADKNNTYMWLKRSQVCDR